MNVVPWLLTIVPWYVKMVENSFWRIHMSVNRLVMQFSKDFAEYLGFSIVVRRPSRNCYLQYDPDRCEAYASSDLLALHEVCHWLVATDDERGLPNYGLGSDPDYADYAKDGIKCYVDFNTMNLREWEASYVFCQIKHIVYKRPFPHVTYDPVTIKGVHRRLRFRGGLPLDFWNFYEEREIV